MREPPARVKGCVSSGKFVTGVGTLARSRQQRQPWEQPGFQLGVTVCISEELEMRSSRLLLFYFKQ